MNTDLLIKRISIFSLFWFSFIGYFMVPLVVDPIPCPNWVMKIDSYIPFIWWMIIPYYSYYVLIIIPPFIILNEKKIKLLTKVLIQMSVCCYAIYLIWPISSSNILLSVKENPLSFMHTLITIDYLHQNALPSMHVSISMVIGLSIILYQKKYKNLMLLIILFIFLATFLTKQHYLIDSISGLIIGYLGFLRYKYLMSHIN